MNIDIGGHTEWEWSGCMIPTGQNCAAAIAVGDWSDIQGATEATEHDALSPWTPQAFVVCYEIGCVQYELLFVIVDENNLNESKMYGCNLFFFSLLLFHLWKSWNRVDNPPNWFESHILAIFSIYFLCYFSWPLERLRVCFGWFPKVLKPILKPKQRHLILSCVF